MRFYEREAVCSNTSIHCAKGMECCFTFKMLSFQRKSLSIERALSYLQAFNRNSHAFLWKRSNLFQHFSSLCEGNGVLFHFLNSVLSEKITFFWDCIKLLASIHQQISWGSLQKKRSIQHFNSLYGVNGVLLPFLNAVVTEIITFYWNCLKLLTNIHQQITCGSLKEKQSVPTLQFTVQNEWSVASLSKCSPFRENHSLLKLP